MLLTKERSGAFAVLGIQTEEEDIFVEKRIVAHPELLVPDSVHHLIADIVIPRQVEKRHFKSLDESVEFIPLAPNLLLVLLPSSSSDQIADRDHKLRLQFINLGHSTRKNSGPHSTRPVRHDRKLEVIRIIAKRPVKPRLFLGLNAMGEVRIAFRECLGIETSWQNNKVQGG